LVAPLRDSDLDDAIGYIRQLSELGQADIAVLKILYDAQGIFI